MNASYFRLQNQISDLHHRLLAVCLVLAIIYSGGSGSNSKPEVLPTPQVQYGLSGDIKLNVRAERGQEGEIFIVGSTNLPDGMKLGVQITSERRLEAEDFEVVVRNGP